MKYTIVSKIFNRQTPFKPTIFNGLFQEFNSVINYNFQATILLQTEIVCCNS